MCRSTLGKIRGLKPKVVYWIYTVAVRPILIYTATVWWLIVKLITSKAEMSKLQRMACLGITGAMTTTLTAGIVALLEHPPLHLQLEAEVKAGFNRINGNEQWKPRSEGFGCARMAQN
jgi:hypothetical protein